MARPRTARRLRNHITRTNYPFVKYSGVHQPDTKVDDWVVLVVINDLNADTSDLDAVASEMRVPLIYKSEE